MASLILKGTNIIDKFKKDNVVISNKKAIMPLSHDLSKFKSMAHPL